MEAKLAEIVFYFIDTFDDLKALSFGVLQKLIIICFVANNCVKLLHLFISLKGSGNK